MGSEPLTGLLENYLFHLDPGETVKNLFQASLKPDVRAEELVRIIESDPSYVQSLRRLDILQNKIRSWAEELAQDEASQGEAATEGGAPSADAEPEEPALPPDVARRIVGLLGRVATRNAMAAIQVDRIAEAVAAAKRVPGRKAPALPIIPKKSIRYAIAAWDLCEEQELLQPDLAYFAGLHFDWISALLDRAGGAAKSEKTYLDELWREGLATARIAYELASIPKGLRLGRYAFAAALLIPLGKVLMAVSFPKGDGPGWKDFAKECAAYGANEELSVILRESVRYPFTHAQLSALVVRFYGVLGPVENAVEFYQEPFVLRAKDPDGFALAVVLSSALQLQAGLKAPAPGAEGPLKREQLEYLKSIGIKPGDVTAVLVKLKT